jgi:ATP-dependent exoDNAse (exonuclease V) beta subunit
MAPAPAIGEDEGGDVSRYLKRLIARRAANEQTRLLYVAATRAKKSLELSGSPKVKDDGTISPRSGTLLANLWPVVAPMLGPAAPTGAAVAPTGTAAPAIQLLRRLVKDWAPVQLSAASPLSRLPVAHQSLEPPEFSWVGETSRHIGTVVHSALEAFAATTALPSKSAIAGRRDFYVYQLRRHGVPPADLRWAAGGG